MSYTKAIKIFEELPEEEKYLIRNRYERDGKHCAMGLLVDVPKRANNVGISDLTNPREEDYFCEPVADRVEELGMTREEAHDLQVFVDMHSGSEEGRPLFDSALEFMKNKESLREHVEDVLVGGCEP